MVYQGVGGLGINGYGQGRFVKYGKVLGLEYKFPIEPDYRFDVSDGKRTITENLVVSANDAYVPEGISRPTLEKEYLNSINDSAVFNDSGQYLRIDRSEGTIDFTDYTIFLVVKPTGTHPSYPGQSGNTTGGGGIEAFSWAYNTGVAEFIFHGSGMSNTSQSYSSNLPLQPLLSIATNGIVYTETRYYVAPALISQPIDLTNGAVIALKRTNNSVTIVVNNQNIYISPTFTTVRTVSFSTIYLGLGAWGTNNSYKGGLSEFLFYGSNINTNDISAISQILMSKWLNGQAESKAYGLQYNPTIPLEAIGKRPVYSYGQQSFDLLSLQPALWLDANDSSTITTVSGAVSEWRDKSGNNRHATQATASNRPLLVANELNGTDIIRFDGSDDILQSTTTIDLTAGFTFFYVGKNRITKNYQGIFRIHNTITTSDDDLVVYYQTGGNSGNLVSGVDNFARYLQTDSIPPSVNTYGIININHNTTSTGSHYVNGVSQTTSNVGSGSLFPPVANNYYIGVGYGDSSRFDGDISQIIIFPRVLTQAERELVEGYLAWTTRLEGNLPSNHPYKNSTSTAGSSIVNIPDWQPSYSRPKARVSYTYINIPPYVDGLIGYRYVGYFADNVSWFNTASLHGDTNVLTSINNFTNSADNYSWMWLGYFYATVSGTWTFYTASDDASYIWLGANAISGYTTSNALVNNGGQHGVQERSGNITLEADTYYPIRIMFGEATGGDSMTVSFMPPNGTKTTNGLGYYYNLEVFEL